MGGVGALIFLATIIMATELRLTVIDFVSGFALGTLTTLFMWTDNFQGFDPWLSILSVIAWQTTIAAVINRRVIIAGVTRLKIKEE